IWPSDRITQLCCTFNQGVGANPTIFADFCPWTDLSAGINRGWPASFYQISRPPTFTCNDSMDSQIFRPFPDVEPSAVFDDRASNPAASTNPVNQNRDKRGFLAGGNLFNSRRVPD